MKNRNDMILLFRKYLENRINRGELQELMHYFGESANSDDLKSLIDLELKQMIDPANGEEDVQQMISNLDRRIFRHTRPTISKTLIGRPRGTLLHKLGIAAAIFVPLVLAGLIFIYLQDSNTIDAQVAVTDVADIAPGGHKATLVLDGGKRVELDTDYSGIVVENGGFSYTDGTSIGLLAVDNEISSPQYATLTTPRGGQYQAVLPDGTVVWLNAASSLRYPTRFIGETREVELVGEAYFEVSHDERRPFIVRSQQQVIQVLGTAFNVNAYEEEHMTTTTLVAGRVRILPTGATHDESRNYAWSEELTPGKQAINLDGQLRINTVDTKNHISWREGRFVFNHVRLSVALRQIERWYDVSFEREDIVEDTELWGNLSQEVMLSEILEVLELNTALKFKREGRRVIMSRK